MAVSRRALLLGAGGVAVVGFGAWLLRPAPAQGARAVMDPEEAHAAALAGDILLVDVRRPDEWAATGVAEGAVPIDLRRPDFVDMVMAARDPANLPVALICARGVRSRHLQAALRESGLDPVIDVPQGMLGSFAGQGWIARGLPVRDWAG